MADPLPIHVWVSDARAERPGLLIGWERRQAGRWGRVIVANDGAAEEWLVEASRLRPAQAPE